MAKKGMKGLGSSGKDGFVKGPAPLVAKKGSMRKGK
jgi:hypothetical protein